MMKHKPSARREHGAITVFMSFVMVAIIGFMGMLMDVARLRVAEAQLKRAGQLSLDAVMTRYSRKLREDYGLFGYAGAEDVNELFTAYFNENLTPARQDDEGEFMRLVERFTGGKKAYGDMLRLQADADAANGAGSYALDNPEILYRQMMEFSKFRVPVELAFSGALSRLMDLKGEVEAVSSEMEAADKAMEAAKPAEEYAEAQSELEEAQKKMNEAIDDLNEKLDKWNDLVMGRDDDTLGYGQTAHYFGFIHTEPEVESAQFSYYSSTTDDEGNARTETYHATGERYGRKVVEEANAEKFLFQLSAHFYNYTETINSLIENLNRVREIYNSYMKSWQTAYENQAEVYNSWVDFFNNSSYYGYESLLTYVDPSTTQQYRDDFSQLVTSTLLKEGLTRVANALLNEYAGNLRAYTQDRAKERDESREALKKAYEDVQKAVENTKEKDQALRDKLGQIDDDLTKMCSTGNKQKTYENWGEEKDEYEKMLAEDEKRIEALETQLEHLKNWAEGADGSGGYDRKAQDATGEKTSGDYLGVLEQAAKWAVEGNDASRFSWDGSGYVLPRIDEEGCKGKYDPYPDREQKQQELDQKRQEAKDRQKQAEQTIEEQGETRENPNAIPGEYTARFIAVGADSDEGSKFEKPDDNMKADEAKGESGKMAEGSGKLLNVFADGLSNVIGAVYGSEYILRMFGNAAPEQEDNEYSADKGYARVTTLRDCEPVGIGSPRFDDEDRELPARLGYFYNSEAEYILFGHDKESTNNFHAQIMLEVMLVAANYLQARNCYELKAIADSAATAGQAIGIPYSLTKFLILMGFAITETALDMYYLMHGYKIPALSTRGDDMFMMHLADVNSVLNTQGSFMLSYEYYLRLRLMFAMMTDGGRNKLMQRMANLIQLNINYAADEGYGYAHDKDFTMAGAYTSFKATAAGKMPWWFMTSGMMGNARTTSGWRAIPNYTIVANY